MLFRKTSKTGDLVFALFHLAALLALLVYGVLGLARGNTWRFGIVVGGLALYYVLVLHKGVRAEVVRFFDIQERALAYAASIYNKQTKQDGISLRTSENAQTHPEEAAKMRAIHSELVEIARRNPAWLHEWQVMGLSLSKFGWYFRTARQL